MTGSTGNLREGSIFSIQVFIQVSKVVFVKDRTLYYRIGKVEMFALNSWTVLIRRNDSFQVVIYMESQKASISKNSSTIRE